METFAAQVADAYRHREGVVRSFFTTEADRLARVCLEMARRFHRGGRILAFGVGSAATDAQHISVEFVHPVIVGKRALPAIALPNDAPSVLGSAAADAASVFGPQIAALGAPEDIAIGLSPSAEDPGAPAVASGLKEARALGMLTIGLSGPGDGIAASGPERLFRCEDPDPFIVQEVHETLYHVLWELVHVFFEHRSTLEAEPGGRGPELGASAFLYPMLERTPTDPEPVIAEVRDSILRKAEDVVAMRRGTLEDPAQLVRCAEAIASRFGDGGSLFALGNGGSATDAQDLVCDLIAPPPGLRSLPALSLTNDAAVVTAVGNDVGFENVFARQVIAYGRPEDVLVGISTSGGSRNLLVAFEEARRRGMTTVALAGYGGGQVAERGLADHALVIDADYIPRIQEAQASQYHVLRRLVDAALARGG